MFLINFLKTYWKELAANRNTAVKNYLREAIEDSDAKNKTIHNLSKENSNLHKKIDNLEEVNHILSVGK